MRRIPSLAVLLLLAACDHDAMAPCPVAQDTVTVGQPDTITVRPGCTTTVTVIIPLRRH